MHVKESDQVCVLEDTIKKLKQKKEPATMESQLNCSSTTVKAQSEPSLRSTTRVGTIAEYHRIGRDPINNQSTRKAKTKGKQEATDPLVFSAALENFLKGSSTEGLSGT